MHPFNPEALTRACSIVRLRNGEAPRLESSGDVGDFNTGILAFPDGSTRAHYVSWAEVGRVDLDTPANRLIRCTHPHTAVNPDVDRFLREADQWQDEMTLLREIALESGLDETIKWRLPCYTCQGSNVAIIQPFKETCAMMFFKGVLLDDPNGMLHPPGRHSHAARRMDFTTTDQVEAVKEDLHRFIRQAVDIERRGVDVPPPDNRESAPEELEQAFEEVPGLKDAFFDLTPGRQRGYIIHFSSPKRSSTRRSRVQNCIPRILDGKGRRD